MTSNIIAGALVVCSIVLFVLCLTLNDRTAILATGMSALFCFATAGVVLIRARVVAKRRDKKTREEEKESIQDDVDNARDLILNYAQQLADLEPIMSSNRIQIVIDRVRKDRVRRARTNDTSFPFSHEEDERVVQILEWCISAFDRQSPGSSEKKQALSMLRANSPFKKLWN